MKVLFLIFILCLATGANAALYRGRTDVEKLKGHENECWKEGVGYIDKGTEKRLPNECAQMECEENGVYTIKGCHVVDIEPPCRVEKGDLSKPYPDCCFEIKCNNQTVI